MKRKFGGIAVAVVLALVGTALLVAYVNRAKDEAIKDEEQVQVLVLTEDVTQGTPVTDLEDATKVEDVPRRLVVPGAVASLDDIDQTFVAGVALQQGEQLIATRFVDPVTLVRVDVPDGLQELTLRLDPERAVGGALQPGDRVGFLLSFEPFDLATSGQPTDTVPGDPAAADQPDQTPNTTGMALNEVLVTSVQFSQQDAERITGEDDSTDDGDSTNDSAAAEPVAEAPERVLLVTVAISTPQAEQIVFAAEFGRIWLTRQNDATDIVPGRIVTLGQAYITVPG